MRFLVDESSGMAIAKYLERAGHDVEFVGETMPQMDDRDVLDAAVQQNRILITNDKDFGELIFRNARKHAGVLLLRLQDESPENRVDVLKSVLEQYPDRLSGNYTVATEKTVRIRSL